MGRPRHCCTAAPLLAIALAAGCASPSPPPVITVNVTLINNGGDFPEEFTQLVVDCQQDFKDGRHGKCRDRARDAKNSADPTVQAAAEVLDVVAATNGGEYAEGAENAPDAEIALGRLPAGGTRDELAAALFSSEVVSATVRGDKEEADHALRRAAEISPQAKARVQQDRCQTDSGAPGCTPPTESTPTTEPTHGSTVTPTSSNPIPESTTSEPNSQPETGPSPQPSSSSPQADGT